MTKHGTSDLETLVPTLLGILDELQSTQELRSTGPSISDTIYAKKLAKPMRELPVVEDERISALRQFLGENRDVALWADDMTRTPENRRNLKALLRIEF